MHSCRSFTFPHQLDCFECEFTCDLFTSDIQQINCLIFLLVCWYISYMFVVCIAIYSAGITMFTFASVLIDWILKWKFHNLPMDIQDTRDRKIFIIFIRTLCTYSSLLFFFLLILSWSCDIEANDDALTHIILLHILHVSIWKLRTIKSIGLINFALTRTI